MRGPGDKYTPMCVATLCVAGRLHAVTVSPAEAGAAVPPWKLEGKVGRIVRDQVAKVIFSEGNRNKCVCVRVNER